MSIFEGLEKYGFDKEKDISIYSDGENVDIEHKNIVEKEALYDKSFICPVCKERFKDKAVKSSRQRIIKIENDLRPVYDYFEMYKYDVILCPKCGYAAINSLFSKLTDIQAKLIGQKIGSKYKRKTVVPDVYDIETAILRYKLALLNAVIKNASSIEKAYLCLKIKWLYAVQIEELMKEEDSDKLEEAKKQLNEFINEALKGFLDAYLKGNFSSFGFDEGKITYVIGQLYSELGQRREAYEWFTKVVGQSGANFRLKEKARDRRDEIKKTANS